MNKIIAIVGMTGSGKSVITEYLESINFNKVYFGGVTMDELKKNNLEVNEKNEKYIREKIRKDYGMGAYAILSLDKIKEYLKIGNVVIDGLYSWEEYKILKEEFKDDLVVLSVVVNKNIRYKRLNERGYRGLTNIEAESRDISEIENLQKGGPIVFADYYILNNSNMDIYIEDIKNTITEILNN